MTDQVTGAVQHVTDTQAAHGSTDPISCNDQYLRESQLFFVDAGNQIASDRHVSREHHPSRVGSGNPISSEVQTSGVILGSSDNTANPLAEDNQRDAVNHFRRAEICDHLRELHRQRQDLHRAEKSLTLQIKAKCRRLAGGEKTEADKVYKSMLNGCEHDLALYALATSTPFINARSLIEQERKAVEKTMVKEAKKLPVYEWVDSVRGFGALGFAQIVGEAGDLGNYATVSRLWKRMGLAVIDGGRQRRVTGAAALDHGYCPSRRSVMWNVGDAMFRAGGEYADLCRARKEREREKAAEEGLTVCPAAKIPAKDKENYRSDGHIHNRAKRYMEKRLLRDLWRAWRDYGQAGQIAHESQLDVAS
jgi:hypothetical protein